MASDSTTPVPLVSVENLCRSFQMGKQTVNVLNGINMSFTTEGNGFDCGRFGRREKYLAAHYGNLGSPDQRTNAV